MAFKNDITASMKVILFMLSLFSFCHMALASQDVVLKSRFDLESSESFINQLRIIFKNNNIGDPYSQEFKKDINIDLAEAIDEMPEDTQSWVRDVQSVLQLKLFESDYNLRIQKLRYSVEEFNSEFFSKSRSNERIEYVTKSYVKGLHLSAEKISFEVELKRTQNGDPIRFSFDLTRPEFIINPEIVAQLPMQWSTFIQPDNILLSLEGIDLRSIMASVVKRPELIDLSADDMHMPKVSIKVGNKEIRFDERKIKAFFIRNKEPLKKGILDLLNIKLKDRLANIMKENPKSAQIPRTYGIAGDVPSVVKVENMRVADNILQIDMDGYFCGKADLKENFCSASRVEVKKRRIIEDSSVIKSLEEMDRLLLERDKNIAFSVSEDFLNQLIMASIRNGLWDKVLEGEDFVLGDEKAFVLAEKPGELSLYLDIVQTLKGSQRILTGRSEIRFPVKFLIRMDVLDVHAIPHLQIKVTSVESQESDILKGYPQYGLPTTVNSVPRFRKKVLKSIMESIADFQGKVLLEIELPELKGSYLHRMEIFSDGYGRGTATIGF